MSSLLKRTGGCACGAVRFATIGEPKRGGLCHCITCRKAHASAFNPFVVFAPEQVEIEGEASLATWESSPGHLRQFCVRCGSRLFGVNGEYELSLGSYDEPGWFTPQYESWIVRREPWLAPLAAPQFDANRVVEPPASSNP